MNRLRSDQKQSFRETEQDPLLGTWVGNYELVSRIGAGGMGIVYLGHHPVIRKKVAIKVLREDVAKRPELVQRFRSEARAISQISHANVVEVTDFGETQNGQFYFVMEYLDGSMLGDLLLEINAPIEFERGTSILVQIARGLSAAHSQAVIHRDLKPDNVFLLQRSEQEIVKILDFGIAKFADLSGRSRVTPRQNTDWGTVLGTPAYMSPEQSSGEEIDARSDIYSLGIIAYEMFVGEVPFDADTLGKLIYKHLHELPVPPRKKNPSISPGLEEIILQCLEKRIERRPSSADEVAQSLEGLLLDSEGFSEEKTNVQILASNISQTTRETPPKNFDQEFWEDIEVSQPEEENRGEPTRIVSSSSAEKPPTRLSRPVRPKNSSIYSIRGAAPTKPPLEEEEDAPTGVASSKERQQLEKLGHIPKSIYASAPSFSPPESSPAIIPIPSVSWEDTSMDISRSLLEGSISHFTAPIPPGLDESGAWEDTSVREEADPEWASMPTQVGSLSSAESSAEQMGVNSQGFDEEKTLNPDPNRKKAKKPLKENPENFSSQNSSDIWDAIPTSIARSPLEASREGSSAQHATQEKSPQVYHSDTQNPQRPHEAALFETPSIKTPPPKITRFRTDAPTPSRMVQNLSGLAFEKNQAESIAQRSMHSNKREETPVLPLPESVVNSLENHQSSTEPDLDVKSLAKSLQDNAKNLTDFEATQEDKSLQELTTERPAKPIPSPLANNIASVEIAEEKLGIPQEVAKSIPLSIPVTAAEDAPEKIIDKAQQAVKTRRRLVLIALMLGALLATVLVLFVLPLLRPSQNLRIRATSPDNAPKLNEAPSSKTLPSSTSLPSAQVRKEISKTVLLPGTLICVPKSMPEFLLSTFQSSKKNMLFSTALFAPESLLQSGEFLLPQVKNVNYLCKPLETPRTKITPLPEPSIEEEPVKERKRRKKRSNKRSKRPRKHQTKTSSSKTSNSRFSLDS